MAGNIFTDSPRLNQNGRPSAGILHDRDEGGESVCYDELCCNFEKV